MKDIELVNSVIEYKEIVIWGRNLIGEYLFSLLKDKYPQKTIVLCDNDSSKQGEYLESKVLSLQEAVELVPNAIFLIVSYTNYELMKLELVGRGITEKQILLARTDESIDAEKKSLRGRKFKRLDKIQFEVDIAIHCNLDCNCCSQFAPLAVPEYVDLVQFQRDFERLSELFNGFAERIYLIGGEPLLYENINECISISRRCFPDAEIDIFTNGLLLKGKNDSFWNTCVDNNISIIVTRYPINVEYESIRRLVLGKGINFKFAGTSKDFKYMSNIGIDIEGKQDPEDSFIHCYEANNCIKLRNGRLYTCTRPAAIYKFNNFFNMQLEVTDNDSIDIYKARSAEEVLEFLSKPIPFCRYCNQTQHRVAREWAHSTKQIDEWT